MIIHVDRILYLSPYYLINDLVHLPNPTIRLKVVSKRINNNIQGGLIKALGTKNKCLICMIIQPIVRREQPKFQAKIAIQHGTLIMKEMSRNIWEYICLKISPVVLYKIVMVAFSEYLPPLAPIVIVLLNIGSKLSSC